MEDQARAACARMANPADSVVLEPAEKHAAEALGPRKLVRPRLAEKAPLSKQLARRAPVALLAHQEITAPAPGVHGGGHAETFYFHKQMQSQTSMIFVLDDGETIEGTIEWYDVHVIKVRHVTRTMIYKSSIKYMYKASDARTGGWPGSL